MKTQKIIKVGNSFGIIISTEFIKSLNLKLSDKVELEVDQTYKFMILKPAKIKSKILHKLEFFNLLNEYTKKYKDLLKELAKY